MIDSILIILSLVFRWIISMGPYSGQGKGPLHGDFEAQRHWMELTNHLPVWDPWTKTGGPGPGKSALTGPRLAKN